MHKIRWRTLKNGKHELYVGTRRATEIEKKQFCKGIALTIIITEFYAKSQIHKER